MIVKRLACTLLVLQLLSGSASAQDVEPQSSFEAAVEAHAETIGRSLDARLGEVAAGHGAEEFHPWIEQELDILRRLEARSRAGGHRAAIRSLGRLMARFEDAAFRAEAFRDPVALSTEIQRTLQSAALAWAKLGGGGISGTVTDQEDGTPLADTVVALRTLGTDLLQTATTDELGYYELTDVSPGLYHVHTQSRTHRDESFDNRPCVSFDCAVFYYTDEFSAGNPVTVESGSMTQGIDFALDPQPVIRGRVVHGETGEPRANAIVEAVRVDGSSRSSAMTDADGFYEVSGLGKGHFLVTAFSGPLVGELYEQVPCFRGLSLDCFSSQGTPVFTDYRRPAEGIDFALDPGAGVQGRVLDETTGLGIPFALALIYRPDGEVFFRALADENGRFGAGLPPGTYYVAAAADPYVSELFDNVSCSYLICDLESGTPIVVGGSEVISAVDLELARGGSFSGTVRDTLGHALRSFPIQAFDGDGTLRARFFSRPDGSYSVPRLAAGTYYAVFDNTFLRSWKRQVYRELPCSEPSNLPCPLGAATPIEVTTGQDTGNIDFALESLQSISGHLVDADTGAPIPNATVSLYRQDGVMLRDVTTDETGFYRQFSISSPVYLLATAEDFVPQAYADLQCPPQDCDPTQGEAIEAPADDEVMGADFQLNRGGGIEGTVRLAGEPLPEVTVSAYDDQGRLAGTIESDAEGRYRIDGLLDGPYFLSAKYRSWTQIYPNQDCRVACDPLSGDSVTVTDSSTRTGVDFNLSRRALIFGRITDTFDRPLSGVEVWVRDLQLDALIASQTTGADGYYEIDGLAAGLYRVSADKTTYSFISTEPVSVQEASGAEVDLRLAHSRGISGRVVSASSGLPVPWVAIDIWSADGELYSQGLTSVDGEYSVFVPGGQWFVSTDNGRGGLDRVYPEAICPQGPVITGACDPRTGEPVTVGSDLVEGIDFALDGIEVFDCRASETVLCLNGGRFRVETLWRDAAGRGNPGQRGLLTQDSAYFWFFDDTNVEVLVKVLDACDTPSKRFWVFAAGLTHVEVTLLVTDTATGISKEYRNPSGTDFQPILDTDAFNTCNVGSEGLEGLGEAPTVSASDVPATSSFADPSTGPWVNTYRHEKEGACEPGDEHLCLSASRFQAELTYRTPQSTEQIARSVQLTDETGYFWFFDARNIEVIVKILDACFPPFDRFWVFTAGLTNLEVSLRVTDTATGEVRTYNNPLNVPFAPIFDTAAFDTCG